ncbi:FAD-dependent oxidoreductase [Georgenia yuyongxinii]|uniref:FAD-dependent oxidoreductase n=2 Tax=Georgenia yuyongxinii TaxID=2589797 RepID=A0A5B8CAE8_9MICO|nr:FAD-dependent oxidoreductase [Georgenia yuyongxinii]
MMSEHFDTVVIGAGQAGLATGYHLTRQGADVVILESRARVGDVWRERYDSLQLYSPAIGDGLPGMAFPAPRFSYPTGTQMADFIESYAQSMALPVRTGVFVERVRARTDGGYLVDTADGQQLAADQVVVTTGGHHRPFVPAFAGDLDPDIVQIHSAGYRNASQLQDGPVLVVGASHSGADLALEVASAHQTHLSGRIHGEIPYTLGRPSGYLATLFIPFVFKHGLTLRTPIGRRLAPSVRQGGGPLIRVKRAHLKAAGVELIEARTVGVQDGLPVLDDGRVLDVRNVLWCTGYREDYRWVEPAPLDEDGFPRSYRGVVDDAPGLYFVGLPFQYAFASMLILGVGRDSAYVARHISSHRRSRQGTGAGALRAGQV